MVNRMSDILEECGVNSLQCFHLAQDVLFREVLIVKKIVKFAQKLSL